MGRAALLVACELVEAKFEAKCPQILVRVGSLVRVVAITPRIWRQGQASKGQGCSGRVLQIRGFRPLPIKPHEKIIGKGRFCLYLPLPVLCLCL